MSTVSFIFCYLPTSERQKRQVAQSATQTGDENGETRMRLQTVKAVTLVTKVPIYIYIFIRKLDKALHNTKLRLSAAMWILILNIWPPLDCKETVAHLAAPSTGEMKSGEKQQPWGRLSIHVSQYQAAIASWVKHSGN